MTYRAYEPCTACLGKAQPGTVAMAKYTMLRFPYASSFGIYNCRNVTGSSTRSNHSCGKAWDCRIPTLPGGAANLELGNTIVEMFDTFAWDMGVMEQVYARVRYDARSPNGRVYTGVHPHNDHDHVGQQLSFAKILTFADYEAIAGPAVPREEHMSLLGLEIGPIDAPSVKSMQAGALQAFLAAEGVDIGEWGPNEDGVDSSAGNDTRNGLKTWKASNGLAGGFDDGDGLIGPYAYAAVVRAGGSGAVDLSDFYTKAQSDQRFINVGETVKVTKP